ncbi:MAG: trypsin-like peptidase domain-containing protein [Alphaproteobacteria bacterium]|nr:trypsin-like peptidase domain-containing protein [Alphaproteobacteria bacterium]
MDRPAARSRSIVALVALVGLGAGATGLVVGVLGGADASGPKPEAPPVEATTQPQVPPAASDPVRRTPVVVAVEKVAPAVVSITTEVPNDDPFSRFRGAPTTLASEGSGVVIEADGLVLTNAHVVTRASRITATFADGRDYEADVLGLDEDLDLAVLQLRDADQLAVVEIGTSSDLMLGEPVIAIGNPFGLGHTVTTGVLSATERPLETDRRVYQDFLQTDASINPGNSGGPLLDVHGRLIGINTAIRADAEGIGFAIPVDRAIKVAHDLSSYGMVRSPWLGVDLEDVYLRDLTADDGLRTAARVEQVYAIQGSVGAGLQAGDVIVGVDRREIQGRGDLNAWLAAFEPGRTVSLDVRRPSGKQYQQLTIELATQALPDEVVDASLDRVLGLRPAGGGPHQGGVPVESLQPDGAFARIGGRAGDAIVAINGRAVSSTDELRAAVASTKSAHRRTALITVRRGRTLSRVELPL